MVGRKHTGAAWPGPSQNSTFVTAGVRCNSTLQAAHASSGCSCSTCDVQEPCAFQCTRKLDAIRRINKRFILTLLLGKSKQKSRALATLSSSSIPSWLLRRRRSPRYRLFFFLSRVLHTTHTTHNTQHTTHNTQQYPQYPQYQPSHQHHTNITPTTQQQHTNNTPTPTTPTIPTTYQQHTNNNNTNNNNTNNNTTTNNNNTP